MLHHRKYSLMEKFSVSVSEQTEQELLQVAIFKMGLSRYLHICVHPEAKKIKMQCCDMAMTHHWSPQQKQLCCSHHRITDWAQPDMTQGCQTWQLSRQQVICQCQRPVILHLKWQYRRNIHIIYMIALTPSY